MGCFWVENKKIQTKSFSVNKYGNDEAKQLATDYRLAKEQEIDDYVLAKQ
jgi:AP2 domain